ncbi:MAG: hypothetical protein ACYC97_11890 [Metallibacterium sp.]
MAPQRVARTRSVRSVDMDRGEWMPFARDKMASQALPLMETRGCARAAGERAIHDSAPVCGAVTADRG